MLLPRNRRLTRAAALGVSAAGLAAALTACGHSGVSGVGGACTTSVPGVTPTEVKAGMIWNDSGGGAGSTRSFRGGVDARLHVVNEEDGGVYGRKITYAWRDDEGDGSLDVPMVEELLDQEKVFGLINSPSSGQGSAKLLQDRNIPVTGVASDPVWLGMNNMFSWFYFGRGSSTTQGRYIHDQGGTRAALILSGQSYDAQVEASLRANNVQVVNRFHVGEVTSYQTVAQQIKASNIDAITGALFPDVAAQLLPELAKIGVTLGGSLKVVVMPLGYDASNLTRYGRAIAGVSIMTATQPFELKTPGQQRFLQAMSNYAPEVQPPAQDLAVGGWISTDLFIRGLQAAGKCPTRESFISGLRAVKNYDGAGLAPDTSIDLSTNYRDTSTCYYFIKVSKDGSAFEPVDTDGVCGDVISPEQVAALNQPS